MIPKHLKGAFIGREGRHIANLQLETGCQINLTGVKEGDDSKLVVEVNGDQSSVDAAINRIETLVER